MWCAQQPVSGATRLLKLQLNWTTFPVKITDSSTVLGVLLCIEVEQESCCVLSDNLHTVLLSCVGTASHNDIFTLCLLLLQATCSVPARCNGHSLAMEVQLHLCLGLVKLLLLLHLCLVHHLHTKQIKAVKWRHDIAEAACSHSSSASEFAAYLAVRLMFSPSDICFCLPLMHCSSCCLLAARALLLTINPDRVVLAGETQCTNGVCSSPQYHALGACLSRLQHQWCSCGTKSLYTQLQVFWHDNEGYASYGSPSSE